MKMRKLRENRQYEDARNLVQTTIRIHKNDHLLMKKLFNDDKLSWQSFFYYCMQAYLSGDPGMLKVIKIYRELDTVPQDYKNTISLSTRERQALLEEIEKSEKSDNASNSKEKEG